MYRSAAETWHTDTQPRLDAVATRNPEWRPWLTLLEETLRELDRPEWAALAPSLRHDRPARAPLLAGATWTVSPRVARAWVRRLTQLDVVVTPLGTSPRPKLATRDLDALVLLEAAICQDE